MKISTRQLFAILLFIGLFAMTLRPVADADFWWHLRTGQLIQESGAIPHEDPFSLTMAGTPWVAHEWLTEFILFNLYRIGGLGLLILVFSAIISGAFLLVYLRSPARPFAAGFILLLAAIASAPTWGVRPQMVSILLVAVFIFFLDKYFENDQWKPLLLLPVLTAVWVNMHAAYILGMAVIGLHILAEGIEILASLVKKERPNFRRAWILSGILVACVAASLINPNTYHILIYPFQTLTSPSMMLFIQEWFSPDFHRLEWIPLAVLLLAIPGTALIMRQKVPLHRLVLMLFFGFFALRSMRNVPFFSLAAIPILAGQFIRREQSSTPASPPTPISRWLNPLLLALMLLATGLRFITTPRGQQQREAEAYPQAAVEWIARERPAGNIFNTYGWGGYLIWKLFPEYPVYIDGRADVYGDEFIYDYLATYHGQPGWDRTLEEDGIRIVLVEPMAGIANALRQTPGWTIACEDALSILFLKDD